MKIKQEKAEKLIQAEKLIDNGNFDEALQVLNKFEEEEVHNHRDIVLAHLIKCDLLLQQGLNHDSVKVAERTYNESLKLGLNLLSVDALIFKAESLIRLSNYDEAFEVNKQGEEMLNKFPENLDSEYKKREASIAFIKGKIYFYRLEADQSIKYVKHSLVLREAHSSKKEIAISLSGLAWSYISLKAEFDKALKYAERGLEVAKQSNNQYEIAFGFLTLAVIYNFLGELDLSILYHEKSLAIYKDLNNKRMMAIVLNNMTEFYNTIGDKDRALEVLEQSLEIQSEVGNLREVAFFEIGIIDILIEKGDLKRAKEYLYDLEQIKDQLKDKKINLGYQFSNALILKNSPRVRNRAKAEEIFHHILKDEEFYFEFTLGSLLNLCDLLLIELRTINDIEIIGEIESYITQLMNLADKSHSYLILCETHLLQAKLSLLTFDMKKAQRLLTQAQQIAERFNFNKLVTKITNEKEDLLKKLDLWERLKKIGAPMSDRLDLARLDNQIAGMVRNRSALTANVIEEEVAIHKDKKVCLVCRGEVLKFSYICECGAIYCENCARAVSDLENVCWACDTPIDYSKPIKDIELGEEAKLDKKKNKKK